MLFVIDYLMCLFQNIEVLFLLANLEYLKGNFQEAMKYLASVPNDSLTYKWVMLLLQHMALKCIKLMFVTVDMKENRAVVGVAEITNDNPFKSLAR